MSSPRVSKSARKSSPLKAAPHRRSRSSSSTIVNVLPVKEDVKYVTRRSALPYARAHKGGESKVVVVPPETFERLHKLEKEGEKETSGTLRVLLSSAVKSLLRNPLSRALFGYGADDNADGNKFLLGRDCIRDLPFFSLTGEILFFSTCPLFLDRVFGFAFNEIITIYNSSIPMPELAEEEVETHKVHATVVGARGHTLWVVLEGDIVARPLPLPLLASSLLPPSQPQTEGTIHEQLVQYYSIGRLTREERARVLRENFFVLDSHRSDANSDEEDRAATTNNKNDFVRHRENDAMWSMWSMQTEGHATARPTQGRGESTRLSARVSGAHSPPVSTPASEGENKVFVFTEKILRRLEREVARRHPMEGPERLQFLQYAPDLFIDIEEDDDEAQGQASGHVSNSSFTSLGSPTSPTTATTTKSPYDCSRNKANRLVLVPRIMPTTNTVGWSAEQTVAAAGGGLPYFRASLSASVVL